MKPKHEFSLTAPESWAVLSTGLIVDWGVAGAMMIGVTWAKIMGFLVVLVIRDRTAS